MFNFEPHPSVKPGNQPEGPRIFPSQADSSSCREAADAMKALSLAESKRSAADVDRRRPRPTGSQTYPDRTATQSIEHHPVSRWSLYWGHPGFPEMRRKPILHPQHYLKLRNLINVLKQGTGKRPSNQSLLMENRPCLYMVFFLGGPPPQKRKEKGFGVPQGMNYSPPPPPSPQRSD